MVKGYLGVFRTNIRGYLECAEYANESTSDYDDAASKQKAKKLPKLLYKFYMAELVPKKDTE